MHVEYYLKSFIDKGFLKTLFSELMHDTSIHREDKYILYGMCTTPVKRITRLSNEYSNFLKIWISNLEPLDRFYILDDNFSEKWKTRILSQDFRNDFWFSMFRRYILIMCLYKKYRKKFFQYMYQDFKSAYECFEYFYIYNFCFPTQMGLLLMKKIVNMFGFKDYMYDSSNFLLENLSKLIIKHDETYLENILKQPDLQFKKDIFLAQYFCKVYESLLYKNIEDLYIPDFILKIGYCKEIIFLLNYHLRGKF